MPTNFTQTLETTGSPLRPIERPRQDVSGYMESVGKNISDVANAFTADKSEKALGVFSGEIADVENQLIQYKQQEADLMEEMMAASSAKADANVISDIRARLSTLRAGRVQGTLSPMAARTYTNKLIKDYSSQYPALSQKIRSMANESMDNIREIHNELFVDDPLVKEARDAVSEAIRNNTSVQNVIALRAGQAAATAATNAYEVMEKTGKVDAKTTINYIQTQAYESALQDGNKMFLDINSMMANNEAMPAAFVTNQFSALRNNYIANHTKFLIEKGAYTKENLDQALAPAFAIFEQIEKILTTQGGTLEERVKLAQDKLTLLNTDRQSKALGLGSLLGGIFEYMPPDAVYDALQAAAQIQTSTQYGAGFELKDWAVEARRAAGMGDVTLGMGMMILQSDRGQQVLGQLIGIKAFGGASAHPGLKDPELDVVSNRGVNDMIARMMDPAQRQKTAGNALPYFDWIDLKHNPAMLAETQANPQYRQHAVTQAAKFASEWLLDMTKFGLSPNDLVVDHSNMQSPITIKGEKGGSINWNTYFQGRTPDYRELNALPVSERLNFMYRDILNTYGAVGVNEWLDALGYKAEGKYRKPEASQGDSGSKKKVMATEFDESFSSAESKYGLPKGLLKRVAGVESSFNPNAMGPVLEDGTRAMGLMQIIPKWHPGVNAMNPKASIDYAGSYLSGLYKKFGSWDKALAAYNWGEGPERMGLIADDTNWKDKLPPQTKQYLEKILG